MPDPIRCSADPVHPNTYSCEPIVIGPEPSPESTVPGSPTVSTEPSSKAVTALVDRFPQRVVVDVPRVAAFTMESAERCAGKLLAFAPLALKFEATAAVALGFVKADYELYQCLTDDIAARTEAAGRAAGVQACEAHGGIVLSQVGDETTCLVSPGTVVTP